jgi:hypothetical protein
MICCSYLTTTDLFERQGFNRRMLLLESQGIFCQCKRCADILDFCRVAQCNTGATCTKYVPCTYDFPTVTMDLEKFMEMTLNHSCHKWICHNCGILDSREILSNEMKNWRMMGFMRALVQRGNFSKHWTSTLSKTRKDIKSDHPPHHFLAITSLKADCRYFAGGALAAQKSE